MSIYTPRSPMHGGATTNGSVNGAPTVQLLNPAGSGVLLKVLELYLCVTGSGKVFVRRTGSPVQVAGAGSTVVSANVVRRDGRSITGFFGQLKASNFTSPATIFTNAQCFWYDFTEGRYQPTAIIRPGSFPLVIRPGSALEIAATTNGAGVRVGAYMVWDEVTQLLH